MSPARGSSVGGAGRDRVGELRDAGRAQLALLRALVRVRTRAIGSLVSAGHASPSAAAAPTAPGRPPATPTDRAGRRILIQRLELALARAERRGLFRPTCLVRSLALADLLARHGVTGAEIRIGVRPQPGGASSPSDRRALEAHAWVELDGTVLGDDPRRARRFTPLGGVRTVEPPSGRDR
ncbi:MAG: lasso peptide biosynthesis B2 protein [Gemmatimonadaceae bacterium]